MADIDVRRKHSLGEKEARQAAEEIAEDLKDKLKADYHWEGDHLRFKRSGAEGFLHVTGEVIEISIKLGLLLKPMRGVIEGKIIEFLDRKLA